MSDDVDSRPSTEQPRLLSALTFDMVGRLAAALAFVGDNQDTSAAVLIGGFSSRECVDAHNILRIVDQMLKAQWTATGQADPDDIL